ALTERPAFWGRLTSSTTRSGFSVRYNDSPSSPEDACHTCMAFSSKKSFNVSASALSSSIIKILFRIVLYREIYDKFCSDTKFTLHFYLRIMSFYQGLHIRKPEPEAGFVPYRLIFAAVEFLKNPGQIFFG